MDPHKRKKELTIRALSNEIYKLKTKSKEMADVLILFASYGYEIKNGNKEIQKKLGLDHIETKEASDFCYKKKEEIEKKRDELIIDITLLEITLKEF